MSSLPIAWTSMPRPLEKESRAAFHHRFELILVISRYRGLSTASSAHMASTVASSASSSTTSLTRPIS